ncbi:MAG TPA: hypothetical protein VGR21_05920, partial [Cryptosporangiaceae bacterium]|nr:hypothetical protein [Cryptosporangiaceae bacterium]
PTERLDEVSHIGQAVDDWTGLLFRASDVTAALREAIVDLRAGTAPDQLRDRVLPLRTPATRFQEAATGARDHARARLDEITAALEAVSGPTRPVQHPDPALVRRVTNAQTAARFLLSQANGMLSLAREITGHVDGFVEEAGHPSDQGQPEAVAERLERLAKAIEGAVRRHAAEIHLMEDTVQSFFKGNGPGDSGYFMTAAQVPGSEFGGLFSDTADEWAVWLEAVRQLDVLPQVARAAGVEAVTGPVAGEPVDRRQVRIADDERFTLDVTVGDTGTDVARSVLDKGRRHARVIVSARASIFAVGRALAHEIAEIAAVLRGAPTGPDAVNVLVPGRPADQPIVLEQLTGHDHGRLAEARYLLEQVRSPDQATRERAQRELAILLEHLGLVEVPAPALADLLGRTRPTSRLGPDLTPQAAGRRPAIGDLIPRTEEDAAQSADEIKAAFVAQFAGVDFAGYRVSEVASVDPSEPLGSEVRRDQVVLRLAIESAPETGGQPNKVGAVTVAFYRQRDGSFTIRPQALTMYDPSHHGTGFTGAFLAHLETWAAHSGVERLAVSALLDAGGYVWAQHGFDWSPDAQAAADALLGPDGHLANELRELDADLDSLRASLAVDDSVGVRVLLGKHRAST